VRSRVTSWPQTLCFRLECWLLQNSPSDLSSTAQSNQAQWHFGNINHYPGFFQIHYILQALGDPIPIVDLRYVPETFRFSAIMELFVLSGLKIRRYGRMQESTKKHLRNRPQLPSTSVKIWVGMVRVPPALVLSGENQLQKAPTIPCASILLCGCPYHLNESHPFSVDHKPWCPKATMMAHP